MGEAALRGNHGCFAARPLTDNRKAADLLDDQSGQHDKIDQSQQKGHKCDPFVSPKEIKSVCDQHTDDDSIKNVQHHGF